MLGFWLALLGAHPVAPPAVGPGSMRCGDLLGRIGRRPAHVVLDGCRSLPDRQGKPLRATYHVAGRFAAAAERALGGSVGLAPLRHSCCEWDGPATSFRDAAGQYYAITMASPETVVTGRGEWPRIPAFVIAVDLYTEEI